MDHSSPAWFASLHARSIVALTAIIAILVVLFGAIGVGSASASGGRHTPKSQPAPAPPAGTPASASPGSTATTSAATPTGAATTASSASAAARRRPTTTTTAPRPTTTVAPATTTTAAAPTGSGAKSVLFGVVTDTMAQLNTFEADAGKRASLYGSYYSFAFDANFDATAASALRARGTQPMVTWEPWDPTSGSASQPAYSLGKIIAGNYDAYITRWATQIKGWNQPLWLRFAHEMNGDWYPWSEGVNGNTAGQYVTAWRHVHDIFQRAGVTNVIWVWTPNVIMGSTPTLASVYPGDAYVDWIGVDGYNWGTTQSRGSTWQSSDDVFGSTLASLQQISGRPIVIGETASTEFGGNKAAWVKQFFASMEAQPRIKAFIWFNLNKETDWRIESSTAARAAFAAGVADPRY